MSHRALGCLACAVVALAPACSDDNNNNSGGVPDARLTVVDAPTSAAADAPSTSGDAPTVSVATCGSIAGLGLPDVSITNATLVAATGTAPEYCNVFGVVDGEIDFNLLMPTTTWNSRFLFRGLGGLDGLVPNVTADVVSGFAAIGTNTGHVSKDGTLYDGSWAYQDPERQVNFAYRSTHAVAEAGKAIVRAFYSRAPSYSYYSGCSGGGRHALMSAYRYPNDFDGIVAGAPWVKPPPQIIAWNWDEQALSVNPIPPSKLSLITNAVLANCDAKDMVTDGLITDPRRCTFDPATLLCSGADGPTCLTAGQVDSLKKLYSGPQNSDGSLFPGWQPGAEATLWPMALINSVNGGPGELLVKIPDQFLKYFIFGPDYDPLTFDFDTDPPSLAAEDVLLDVQPQMGAFAKAGGKIITYHGWADPRLASTESIDFRAQVAANLPADVALDDFYRLFMVPGMGHCAGGPGPDTFDTLSAIEAWVEQGVAPDQLIASHKTAGTVDRTRPLCVYPKAAAYVSGDTDDASSFTCSAPPTP